MSKHSRSVHNTVTHVVWCGVVSFSKGTLGETDNAVVGCGVVWSDVMLFCEGTQCCGVCCGVVWRDVLWCGVVLWRVVVGVAWCGVAWCGVLCCVVLCCVVLCCGVVWCGSDMAWHGMA